ncbi:MAG TPA: phosphoglycerate kinase [Rhabdochlamydiaceae bacterium]|jgi:phosphoglycerate kinase
MNKLKLQDLDLAGKKVLMRVDFNVPMDKEGNITDDTRIREALPSIQHTLKCDGSLILMAHLGNPQKETKTHLSLKPCASALSTLLHRAVLMASDCIGPQVQAEAAALKKGEILLLENVRFHAAEEKPSLDPHFAKQLASLGDIYVNDAFGSAHRAHSSTFTIAQYFPGKAAAGLLLQKETHALKSLLFHPKHPFYAIIGGAKILSKIGVLEALSEKVDALFVGGGMAYPFLKMQNIPIGDSICDSAATSLARTFFTHCAQRKLPLHLPKDFVIANAFADDAQRQIVNREQGIPEGWQGMDIGPQTLHEWQGLLKNAATIFWNGPLGVFEFPHFSQGTNAIARTLAALPAITVVGGGDSLAAINHLHLASDFTHISTGGGASLEFIEKGHLPGIDALTDVLSNNGE